MDMIDEAQRHAFQTTVWQYYQVHGRHDLPWRLDDLDPYKIMVSELMLQQTQVTRVIPKYQLFLELFPGVATLAAAGLGDVLRVWTGLGYNRRAKFLWQAAGMLHNEYHGIFPRETKELVRLPGIGSNTAGAIQAYAFNLPVVFIETNIRTVYIHHFFNDEVAIADAAIIALVAETLDRQQPRDWYWALMDYGSFLKKTVGNFNKQSKTYAKQPAFHGSKRQIRGKVIALLSGQSHSLQQLAVAIPDQRLDEVLRELVAEGLVRTRHGHFRL